jgi:hypothetical protein
MSGYVIDGDDLLLTYVFELLSPDMISSVSGVRSVEYSCDANLLGVCNGGVSFINITPSIVYKSLHNINYGYCNTYSKMAEYSGAQMQGKWFGATVNHSHTINFDWFHEYQQQKGIMEPFRICLGIGGGQSVQFLRFKINIVD